VCARPVRRIKTCMNCFKNIRLDIVCMTFPHRTCQYWHVPSRSYFCVLHSLKTFTLFIFKIFLSLTEILSKVMLRVKMQKAKLSVGLTSVQLKICWIGPHPVLWLLQCCQTFFYCKLKNNISKIIPSCLGSICTAWCTVLHEHSYQTRTVEKAILQKWDEIDDQAT